MPHPPLTSMPTTRFERFRFYRQRALRRLRRFERRRANYSPGIPGAGKRSTCRRMALTTLGKQEPREYPRTPNVWGEGFFPYNWWRVRPHRNVIGVQDIIPLLDHPDHPEWAINHPRTALREWVTKRVKSVPRAKYIARLPYLLPAFMLPREEFYPFPTYPSGGPSYSSTLPEE